MGIKSWERVGVLAKAWTQDRGCQESANIATALHLMQVAFNAEQSWLIQGSAENITL